MCAMCSDADWRIPIARTNARSQGTAAINCRRAGMHFAVQRSAHRLYWIAVLGLQWLTLSAVSRPRCGVRRPGQALPIADPDLDHVMSAIAAAAYAEPHRSSSGLTLFVKPSTSRLVTVMRYPGLPIGNAMRAVTAGDKGRGGVPKWSRLQDSGRG
jgi:hypothetical protein